MSVTSALSQLSSYATDWTTNDAKAAAWTAGKTAARAVGAVVGGSLGAVGAVTWKTLGDGFSGAQHGGKVAGAVTVAGVLTQCVPNSMAVLQRALVGGTVAGAVLGALTSDIPATVQGIKDGAVAGDDYAAAAFDTSVEALGSAASSLGQSLSDGLSVARDSIASVSAASKRALEGYDVRSAVMAGILFSSRA